MIGEYTSWFENLDIYQEWMKNLPEPFNNAAFASAVFLGAVFFLLTAVVNRILLVRWNARQRKAKRRREEQRRQEMDEQRERDRRSREDREQIELYLRFLMTAQMQNVTSLQGITFGQWKAQMLAEQLAGEACQTAGKTEEETGIETGADAGDSTKTAEKAEMGAMELSGMLSEPAEICAEKAAVDSVPENENENSNLEVRAAQADDSFYLKRNKEEISLQEKQNALEAGIPSQENGDAEAEVQEMSVGRNQLGFEMMPEEEEPVRFTGELGFPMRRTADDTVEEPAEPGTSTESLRSVDMAAVMEQIRRDGDSSAAGELSSEQQSDFARVLAQMREDARQQDYLERFQQEKSEIIRNNLSVLDKSVHTLGENPTEEKGAERKAAADEEMERRKEAAREAIRQAERLEQEKGKKKGLFGRKK